MTDSITQIKKSGKVRIGTLEIPGAKVDETFEADIARLVSKEIFGDEDHVEFIILKGEDRVVALKENRVDLVIGLLTILPERQEQIAFSDPYFIEQFGIMVLKNSDIKSLQDLKGKKVGFANKESNALKNFEKYFPDIKIEIIEDKLEAMRALKVNTIQAYSTVAVFIANMIKNLPGGHEFRYFYPGEPFPKKNIAIGIKKNDQDLLTYINSFIAKISSNGKLNAIYEKHGLKQ